MSNLNPLWVGLLGIGLGQTLPVLAEQPTAMATPAAVASFSVAQPLSDRPVVTPHTLLAQAVAAPTKASQASSAQSLTQWAERYRCGASAAGLKSSPQLTNRYEMAALLASCLDSLGDRPLNAQEQSAIKTLRSEFKLELAALQDSQSDLIRLRQSIDSNPGTQASGGPSIRWVKELDRDSLLRRQETVVQGSSLGIKAEASLGKIGIFGRYSVAAGTPLSLPESGAVLTRRDLDLMSDLKDRSFQNWSAGIGIRGFIIPKSVLTLSAGRTLANPLGQLDSNNYGAFYQFPIGDRLTLSPSVVIISNPTNPSNPDIQGAVQASFSF